MLHTIYNTINQSINKKTIAQCFQYGIDKGAYQYKTDTKRRKGMKQKNTVYNKMI